MYHNQCRAKQGTSGMKDLPASASQDNRKLARIRFLHFIALLGYLTFTPSQSISLPPTMIPFLFPTSPPNIASSFYTLPLVHSTFQPPCCQVIISSSHPSHPAACCIFLSPTSPPDSQLSILIHLAHWLYCLFPTHHAYQLQCLLLLISLPHMQHLPPTYSTSLFLTYPFHPSHSTVTASPSHPPCPSSGSLASNLVSHSQYVPFMRICPCLTASPFHYTLSLTVPPFHPPHLPAFSDYPPPTLSHGLECLPPLPPGHSSSPIPRFVNSISS